MSNLSPFPVVRKQIAFIDPQVKDYATLVNGVKSDVEVVILKKDQDGIEQITQHLHTYGKNAHSIEALHVISHGHWGQIQLGSTQLNLETLCYYSKTLQGWSNLLSQSAEILLYGCRVAGNAIGRCFVDRLSELTKRAIAASTTLTGNTALGGTWELGYRTGKMRSALVLDEEAIVTYPHTLGIIVANPFYAVGRDLPINASDPFTQLYIVDIENGTSTKVGTIEFDSFAIARQSDSGRIYYVERTTGPGARVGYWDPLTGGTVTVGTVGAAVPSGVQFFKLAQADNGTIYGLSNASNKLFSIDPNTGTATDLGLISGLPSNGGDIAFDPNNPDLLFISSAGNAGDPFELYTVDVLTPTLTATKIGEATLSLDRTGSLGFANDGNLYASSGDQLVILDYPNVAGGIIPTINRGALSFAAADFGTLPTLEAQANLTITKTDNLENVAAGSNVTYTISITNNENPERIIGMIIKDTLPSEFTESTISWTATVDNVSGESDIVSGETGSATNDLVVQLTLGPEDTLTIEATGTLDAATATGTIITNTVEVPGITDTSDDDTPTDTTTVADATDADLSLLKSISNSTPNVGDTITYTLTLSNTGPANATGVQVTDQVPTGLTFVSSNGTYNSATGIWDVGTVNNGANATLEIVATVNAGATSLSNTAQVSASDQTDPDSTPGNNNAAEDDQATVNTTITSTNNEPPDTQDKLSETIPNDEPAPVPTLTAIDPDVGDTISSFTITSIPDPSQGQLLLNGNPVTVNQQLTPEEAAQLVFNPNPAFTGNATFNYTATDNNGNTDLSPATVTIPVVAPTPTSPPEAQDKTGETRPNDEPSPVPTLTGIDPDNDVSFFTVTTIPPASQGTLFYNGVPVQEGQKFTPEQAGQLIFNPNPSFTGDVTFNYTVTDEAGNTDPTPATVTLPLVAPTPTNPPEAQDKNGPVRPNDEPSPVPTLTGIDPDNDVSFFTVTTIPPASQGTLFYNGVPVQEGQKFTPEQAGQLIFNPNPSFTGDVTFNYTVTDEAGNTDPTPATVTLPLVAPTPTNPPEAQDKTGPTRPNDEPSPVPTLTGTDPDNDVSFFTVTNIPPASQGTLFYNGEPVKPGDKFTPEQAGQLIFNPNPNFTGDVTFNYTVTDEAGNTDPTPATVTLPLVAPTPTNPPEALDRSGPVRPNNEPSPVPTLTGTDPDGDVSFFTVTTLPPPSQGTLFYNGVPVQEGQKFTPEQAGQLIFNPNPNFTGDVTFNYTVTDEAGNTDPTPATVTLPLVAPTPTNPPEAQDKNGPVRPNDEPSPVPTLTGTDPDGDVSFFTVTTLPPPSQGTLFYNGVPVQEGQKFTPEQAGQLVFNPNPNFTGNATFNYTATDSVGNTDLTPATVTLPVAASVITAPPEAQDKTAPIRPNNEPSPVPTLTGTDPDGDVSFFTVSSIPTPQQGTLFYKGVPVQPGQTFTPDQAGELVFQPNPNFTGDVTFDYTVTDSVGNTDQSPAKVTLPVSGPSTTLPPEAIDRSGPIRPNNEPSPVPTLIGTDPDGDVSFFTVTSIPTPEQGTLFYNGVPVKPGQTFTPEQAGQLIFSPNPNFAGNVTFNYTVTDGVGNTDPTPATVTLPIQAATSSVPPVPQSVQEQPVPNNTPSPVTALSAFDPDGEVAFIEISSTPTAAQGTLFYKGEPVKVGDRFTPDQARQLVFDPNPTFTGNVQFQFDAIDNGGNRSTNPGTVTIPVLGATPTAPPVANPATSEPIAQGTSEPASVPTLTGSDPDGIVSFFTIGTPPTPEQGTLFLNGEPVVAGQLLTPEQASQLTFVPNPNFTGDATFTFLTTDERGNVSAVPGVITLPVVGETAGVTPQPDGGVPPFIPIGSFVPSSAGQTITEVIETTSTLSFLGFDWGAILGIGSHLDCIDQPLDFYAPSEARVNYTIAEQDFFGTEQAELLRADHVNNRIYGYGGYDLIMAYQGDDTVFSGTGNDTAYGGRYHDILLGQEGFDILFGDQDNDTIFGGPDDDQLYGGQQNDWLLGGLGNDTAIGDRDNDWVFGEEGYDSLMGHFNQDIIFGGINSDTIHGGQGWDILFGGQHPDTVFGDLGNDTVHGNLGNDSLMGGMHRDWIYGDQNRDVIHAGQGHDVVFGGQDEDTVFGDRHNDTISGDDGDDSLMGNTCYDVMFGGRGNDTMHGGQQTDLMFGGQNEDSMFGDRGRDVVSGDRGFDILFGNLGGDFLFGGTERDTIFAGQDDDWAYGGRDSDLVSGDRGNDIVSGDRGSDYLFGNQDNDTIYGCTEADWIHGGQHNDVLYGGKDNDTLNGDRNNDVLFGDLDNDSLLGNQHRDILSGGAGNDILFGGQQEDTLYGNQGDDTLSGDLGQDILFGGEGIDLFVLRTGSAANDISSADIVGDFQIGLDFIGLTGGLTFVDVTLEVLNNTTLIKITQTNQVLGIVNGVTPDQLIPALIPVDIGLV